jgi:hypothetical protein
LYTPEERKFDARLQYNVRNKKVIDGVITHSSGSSPEREREGLQERIWLINEQIDTLFRQLIGRGQLKRTSTKYVAYLRDAVVKNIVFGLRLQIS